MRIGRVSRENERVESHERSWSILGILDLPLHESSIHHDGVLSISPDERCDYVVADLSISRLGSEDDRVGMIESPSHVNFSPRELGNRCRAAVVHRRVSVPGLREGAYNTDSLYSRGESDGFLMQFLVELIDQVYLPFESLDLPRSEAEREDGHEPHKEEEGSRSDLVASALREVRS